MRNRSQTNHPFYQRHRTAYTPVRSTAQADYEFAIETLNRFWEKNKDINMKFDDKTAAVMLNRLQSAALTDEPAKGHEPAKVYEPAKAYLACMLIGLHEVEQAYKLLLEASVLGNKDKHDPDANYVLAFCILNTNKHADLDNSVNPQDGNIKKMAYRILLHKDFLDFLKEKYNALERLPIVKQLLNACGPCHAEAVSLLKRITDAEQKKLKKVEKVLVSTNEKKQEKNRVGTEILNPLNILKMICQVADGTIEESDDIITIIRKNVHHLKDIPRCSDFWELIFRGFLCGNGKKIDKLEEYGAYAILFPPIFGLLPAQQKENEEWFKARIDLIDKNSSPFQPSIMCSPKTNDACKKIAALLIVKELIPQLRSDSARRVHTKYKIQLSMDTLVFHFYSLKECKQKWLTEKEKESKSMLGFAPKPFKS